MLQLNRLGILSAASLCAFGAVLLAQSDPKPKTEPKRPQISLKATPSSGMVPVRVSGVVELRGGDDDFAEYYCPTIEWNWDDGTVSESSNDCEPYESGKSQIKRRFTADHVYRTAGDYRIQFRLKKKDKALAAASASVKIRPGLGDPGGER